MKKIIILLAVMLIHTSLSLAQKFENAQTIRQKVAEFAKKQGMVTEFIGDQALTMTTDDAQYALIVNGENPTYVEIRFADLDISARDYDVMLKTVNYINQDKTVVKASIQPNRNILRISTEMFAFDAQSVTQHFEHYIDIINDVLKESRERYDEFAANKQFNDIKMPFEVYYANIINTDFDSNPLSEVNGEIKSAETQYIHIGVSLIVHQEGEYPIDIKFVLPNGSYSISDVDAKYTFSTTMPLSSETTFFDLGGWGSSTPGTWKPGKYCYQLFYKGQLFYVREFEIKE